MPCQTADIFHPLTSLLSGQAINRRMASLNVMTPGRIETRQSLFSKTSSYPYSVDLGLRLIGITLPLSGSHPGAFRSIVSMARDHTVGDAEAVADG